ncbi:MAG: isoaspartyl peptidase/L-asparaginase [Chlorobi bacterium]|nr:isoaspartyl peptidase/L-asparaginase [Chlorobiota bacterium]
MIRNLLLFLSFLVFFSFGQNIRAQEQKPSYVLVIHGGAGVITKKNMTPEKEKQYTAKLKEALQAGEKVLKNGGSSLDAVTASILVMENSPLFNAGKGAVFTAEGTNEMDASIMDGRDLNAGAVASVRHIKNPILGARAVMEHTPHVLIIGEGAEEVAAKNGVELVDTSYFFTQKRWDYFQKVKKEKEEVEKHGTVGAVALDMHGNLAAGTSTGGMTYKMKGRVGDSPIIGAGTYADNNTCAVSATGHGEYFMRYVVTYDITALMKYKGYSLQKAANEVIMHKLKDVGGDGGIIAVDKNGNISMTFNTPGMFRGYVTSEEKSEVRIYKD